MGKRLIWLKSLTEFKMAKARSHKQEMTRYKPGTWQFLKEQVAMLVAVREAKKAHRQFLILTILGQEMQS